MEPDITKTSASRLTAFAEIMNDLPWAHMLPALLIGLGAGGYWGKDGQKPQPAVACTAPANIVIKSLIVRPKVIEPAVIIKPNAIPVYVNGVPAKDVTKH